MDLYETFLSERIKIGEGMMSRVFSWNGFAYKCFADDYPAEWIDYEYAVQNEICKTALPVPRFYPSEFPRSIKMDLINGTSMAERLPAVGKDALLSDLMTWFQKIHDVKGLDLPDLSKFLSGSIGTASVTEEQKARAKQYLAEVESGIPEPDALCHMDFHTLNVLYEGGDVRIIDWIDAKNGKPVWDYARTYVILYEYAAGLKLRYLKQVRALEAYPENLFMKAVYVNAVYRLTQHNSKRIRQLIKTLEQDG